MKTYKIISLCLYIASVGEYIAAFFYFMSDNPSNLGSINLCIASAMLCLGSVFYGICRKGEDDQNEKK